MTERTKYKNAMRSLIEATHSVSALVNVPVETLILAMLAAVKRDDADTLLEAAKFYAPLRMPTVPKQGESLVPTSAAYEHLLTLIQRDNPQLYKKLTGLD
jgi:hypothetical protein